MKTTVTSPHLIILAIGLLLAGLPIANGQNEVGINTTDPKSDLETPNLQGRTQENNPIPACEDETSSHTPKPQPDMKTESFADRLVFKKVILEEPNYHIWGSSPVKGNDGRIHVFCSRIPITENPKTHHGFDEWYATSEIAHYVALHPEGPYKFVEVLLGPGKAPPGAWNSGAHHNPTVSKVSDSFVLLYHTNQSKIGQNDYRTFRIGMMTTKNFKDWSDHGEILAGPTEEDVRAWGFPGKRNSPGVDNPALLAHPNGKFYLYYRARWLKEPNNNTYAVAIANRLEGPYQLHAKRIIDNPRYIEDPYVYMDGNRINLLVTDNHMDKGLILSSEDPLNFSFSDNKEGFHVLDRYLPKEIIAAGTNYRHSKLERPQLLMQDRQPTHLFAPSGCNINRGPGTACYLFEIIPEKK